MRRTSLDKLCAVICLLIYGGVSESSHEHIESLYKMDGKGRLVFPVVMAKNRFRFLLSVIRFDDKATRTERLEECGTCSWVCVNHCVCLVQLSASVNSYSHSEEDVNSGKIYRKNQESTESKCDCATKYIMNAKVYLGKENNEIARGLASDVDCTLVQPISGQDIGGRNVTTDNFFTSVDLANKLKNKKKLHL